MFYFEEIDGKKILKSDFLKNINAFFTTRDVMPDRVLPAHVNIISPEQTHSDHVKIFKKGELYPDTDSLIITDNSCAICLKFADCTPLMFYNPKINVGAIAHAGWRGTASKIGVKTIDKIIETFGGKKEDIIAVIGPAIGLCCYEVSNDVKEKLLNTVKNKTNLSADNKVDLKSINAQQLIESGIEKIDICPYCTSCNNDLFYSYRKENGTSNRHYAVMRLK